MTYPVPTQDPNAAGPITQLPQQTIVPPSQQLSRNPMLPQSPLGAYTDAQYEAAAASLRSDIAKQYADVLQKLGYQDENGNFIMGSVEDESNRQQALAQRSIQLADEGVTQQHQGLGTLFSGLRGTDQARAEFPYVQNIADLQRTTPITLQSLYEQAAGLMGSYTLQNNQLLADAASRRAAALQNVPPASGGGDTTPPPADGGVGGPLPELPTNIPGTGTEGLPVAPSQGPNTMTIGGVPYVAAAAFTPPPAPSLTPAPVTRPPAYNPTASFGIARPPAPPRRRF